MNKYVSIIIPVRNEERHIRECLESVLAQSYPIGCMEVIVVDGMSEDGTSEIVKQIARKSACIKLVTNHRRIVPCALNVGIGASKGDVIVRMDAHTYYDRDYVLKCVETLEKTNAWNVGGPIVTLPGAETLVAKGIAAATSHVFGVGNSKFRTSRKPQYVDTVTFGAFRREVFDRVGIFNEKLERNQDIEMNSRIIAAGGRIYLNPEIKSYYYNQSTLKGLWRQNYANGMWNVFTLMLNRKSLSLRHVVPFVFVSSLAASIALSLAFYPGLLLFIGIVGMYLVVSAGVSAAICGGIGRLTFVLMTAFATLHISYGLGFASGLVRRRTFNRA